MVVEKDANARHARRVHRLEASVGSTEVARNADTKDVQSVPNQEVLVFPMGEASAVVLKAVLK
jgi:hypothetical protein